MTGPECWLAIGFVGQGIFTGRFLVQWIASEKRRDAVVPVAFWWLSLIGGTILLSYAIYRRDRVFIVGQGMGLAVYVRNLMLIARREKRADRAEARPGTARGPRRRSAGRAGSVARRSK